jgi:hypothetical protein
MARVAATFLRLWLAATLLLCSACQAGRPPCLSGHVPSVPDHPPENELFELARLEYERSRDAPAELTGRLLERFPSLLPDVGIGKAEPNCACEFVEEMSQATFGSDKVEFNALLVSRIRAVGNIADTSDVMPQKASFLLELAGITESRLTDYRLLPGERGSPPPKALIRQLALGELSASNLFYNDKRVQSFLRARLQTSRDPRELLLLHAAAAQDFHEGYLGQKASDPKPRLLASWLDELPVQVARAAGPEELELVLLRLRLIGLYGEPFSAGDRARKLLHELLEQTRTLAICSAHAGIGRDFTIALRAALFDLERENPLRFVPHVGFPKAHRPDFDPYENWLAPTKLELSKDLSRRRLNELESDLERFEYAQSRCAILSEMPRYARADDAGKLFAFLVKPAAKSQKRSVDETRCRIAAALELPKLEAEKAALLARLVDPKRLAKDESHMIDGVVASHLSDHPELMSERPELQSWVLGRANLPAMSSWGNLQSIVEIALSGLDPNSRVAILRGWMRELETLPASGGARRPPSFRGFDLWSDKILHKRLFTIADFAKESGLDSEARALVKSLLERFGPRTDYDSIGLARAAVIAITLLDLP